MGSGGVLFQVERDLAEGAFIQLSVSWPVLLDDSCPMRLVIFGRVLRSGGRKCACSIDKYEFRTQARVIQAAPPRTDYSLERWADAVRKENLRPRLEVRRGRSLGDRLDQRLGQLLVQKLSNGRSCFVLIHLAVPIFEYVD